MFSNPGFSNRFENPLIPQLNNTLHIIYAMTPSRDKSPIYAINAMPEFKGKSLEELRNEDYKFLNDPNSLSNFDRQALEARIAGTSFNFLS